MRTTFLFVLGLLSVARAQGIKDNSAQMNDVESNEIMLDDGNYYVQNVATGHYLQFTRPGDTTDLRTLSNRGSITIEYGSAKGRSGRKTGTYVGSVFSGMSKCMSAQFNNAQGIDYAAVSYACSVNGGSGTGTLEKAKQFWKLYPCGAGASSNGGVSLASKKKGKSKKQSTSFSKPGGSTKKSSVKKSGSSKKTSTKKTSTKKTSTKKTVSTKQKSASKKKAPSCKKTGKWLARHPEYVTRLGHPECRSRLSAYRKAHRRRSEIPFDHTSRFARLSRRGVIEPTERSLEKRGALMGTYCIIAVDHLSDMQTRAVGDTSINTVGGYVSMELNAWNQNDKTQQWIITSA